MNNRRVIRKQVIGDMKNTESKMYFKMSNKKIEMNWDFKKNNNNNNNNTWVNICLY